MIAHMVQWQALWKDPVISKRRWGVVGESEANAFQIWRLQNRSEQGGRGDPRLLYIPEIYDQQDVYPIRYCTVIVIDLPAGNARYSRWQEPSQPNQSPWFNLTEVTAAHCSFSPKLSRGWLQGLRWCRIWFLSVWKYWLFFYFTIFRELNQVQTS